MLKKSSDKKTRLGVKCGDCLHYDKCKHPNHEDVCVKLGVREKANAPDCFHPDFYKLNVTKSPDLLQDLAKLLSNFRPSQLRVLGFTLTRGSRIIEKYDLKFGQPVYFSLGGDYLAHYFKGVVVGCTDEHVIVSAKLKKCDTNTVGQFQRSTLLTRKQWKVKRDELMKAGKVTMSDEDKRKYKKLPIAELMDEKGRIPYVAPEEFDYEPPTVDTDPEWFERFQEKGKKKGKKGKDRGYIPITNIEDIPVRSKKKQNFDFDGEKFLADYRKKEKQQHSQKGEVKKSKRGRPKKSVKK